MAYAPLGAMGISKQVLVCDHSAKSQVVYSHPGKWHQLKMVIGKKRAKAETERTEELKSQAFEISQQEANLSHYTWLHHRQCY